MDQRALLESRVVCQIQELAAAEESIDQIPSDVAAVVRNRLAAAVKELRAPLETLRRSLASPDAAPSVAMHWQNYLECQAQCCEVFEESLPVLQGIALRLLGWDGGLCQVADKLLTKLANDAGMDWDRITLMAEGEEFRPIPQVIWIRYPAASIWDLPIAAHELGHYIGPRLEEEQNGKTARPIKVMIDDAKNDVARLYLHEVMADVFATYTLGPAYACSCLLGRFDPTNAHEEGAKHPSDSKRSYAILRTLEQLDGNKPGTFTSLAGSLQSVWNDSLKLCGSPTSLKEKIGAAGLQDLDQQVVLLFKKLDDRLKHRRYSSEDWKRCEDLVKELAANKTIDNVHRWCIADVLNAAWYARTIEMDQGNRKIEQLGHRALEMCKVLAQ